MANRVTPLAVPLSALFALLCLGSANALALESLQDPTRPASAGNAGSNGADGDAMATGGLQSIIRREGKRPQALINGELLSVGDKVGASKLVRIGEGEVTLEGPGGKEILTLTPGIAKQPSATLSEKKRGANGSKPGKQDETR